MANRQAFGRRINPHSGPSPQHAPMRSAPLEASSPIAVPAGEPSLDSELQAWKQARGSQFKMPWTELSLMASLCFGVASFVLPDSINRSVDWLLWGLSAMAAIVWFSNRGKKKLRDPAAP